jgi:hypothetical protein
MIAMVSLQTASPLLLILGSVKSEFAATIVAASFRHRDQLVPLARLELQGEAGQTINDVNATRPTEANLESAGSAAPCELNIWISKAKHISRPIYY